MLDVGLCGAWWLICCVGTLMARRPTGSIMNISSTAGLVGYRHFAGYVAASTPCAQAPSATPLISRAAGSPGSPGPWTCPSTSTNRSSCETSP
ncbi:hypothetical protein ACFYSF_36470 [Streptomyces canus]|uniref:hypothetical protein n=1 Tax=Streptomyces canus TaxID=58343 RepID=UPI00368CFCCA